VEYPWKASDNLWHDEPARNAQWFFNQPELVFFQEPILLDLANTKWRWGVVKIVISKSAPKFGFKKQKFEMSNDTHVWMEKGVV
jgi:hypothetical protein